MVFGSLELTKLKYLVPLTFICITVYLYLEFVYLEDLLNIIFKFYLLSNNSSAYLDGSKGVANGQGHLFF